MKAPWLQRCASATLFALAVAGCDLSGTPPVVEVYAGSSAAGTAIAPGQAYFVADPLAQTLTLFVTATAGSAINSMRCTRYGTDIEPATTSGAGLSWSRSYEIPLNVQHELIELRVMDRRLNETVRAVHVYHNPDIIDEVFVAGRRSDLLQSVWAGDPMHLVVSLHDAVVGSYAVTALAESWDGSAYVATGQAEPATTVLTFPGAPGRYRYTIRAEDAATGVYETVQFLAFVHGISITDDWGAPGPGTYPHAASGRNLEAAWGNLDQVVGPGLWVVKVDASTPSLARTYLSGTTGAIPFADTGDYVVRVGVRKDAASAFTYSRRRSTGYAGTNTAPPQPTAPLGPTLSASAGGAFVFDVSATDVDGDPVSFEVNNIDLANLSFTYDRETATYSLSYRGTTMGSFGNTDDDPAWEFTWNLEAGAFDRADTKDNFGIFTLSFAASDRFGGYSTELLLVFTVTP